MKPWLRWGCLIVVTLVGVIVIVGAFLFGTALVRTYGEEVVTNSLHQEVTGPGSGAPPGFFDSGDGLKLSGPVGPDARGAGQPDGKVVLNLFVGEFSVEAGKPGDGIVVEAEYDENSFELTESFEPSADGPWTYRIGFRQTGLFRDNGLRALFGGAFPRIVIKLPPDVPLALEGAVGMGGTTFHLGGLWLTEVELNAQKGGCMVEFSEPTVAPMERLSIRGKQGGLAVVGVANAGPRKVEIAHSMGGSLIDLSGEWHLDSDIRVRGTLGGTTLRLPRNTRIDWADDGSVFVEGFEQPEEPGPTLRMSVTKWIGPIRVQQF